MPDIHRIPTWAYILAALVGAAAVIIAALINKLGDQPPTPAPSTPPPITSAPPSPAPPWELGELIYEENFEDEVVTELKIKSGTFDIIRTSDGNYVWRTSTGGDTELTLSTVSSNYAVEAKIMQVSDKQGFGGFHIRGESFGCPGYQVYMDISGDWLNLVEKSASCDELRETGLFANYNTALSSGVWYTLRMEAKETEARVYLDGNLVLRDKDIDGSVLQSNLVGIWVCCDDLLPYTFDFDDIRVWLIKP